MSRNRSLLVLLALLAFPAALRAQDAEQFFKTYCVACHTIGGGKLVGPDLKGVTRRRDRSWLVRYLQDPPAMIASGDAYAKKLLAEANNVQMPKLPGLDRAMAERLVDFLGVASGESMTPTQPIPEGPPFTDEQRVLGKELFLGRTPLRNGGPACFSCHNVAGLEGWGGGRLGPDLTKVFTKLGGRRAMTAWLGTPSSPTMAPIFQDHPLDPGEVQAILAFFAQKDGEGVEAAAPTAASFFYSGVAAALAILALFGFLWRNRYRATRSPMVESSKR